MDNAFIIDNLLEQEEDIRIAFKANPNIDTIGKTITAFINTQGGDLLLGVDEHKKIVGVKNAPQWISRINEMISTDIKPLAPVSTQIVTYKKREIILISIWEGSKKPYQYKDNIYLQEGDRVKTTDVSGLNQLIAQRKSADFEWERRTVLGSGLNDLDEEELFKTIEAYRQYKQYSSITDVEDFLFQTGLMQGGSLTNACIVLFGKNPVRYIPQSRIRLTVYPGEKSSDVFVNDFIMEDNLFKNITTIFTFLDTNFGKQMIVDGTVRTERYHYPRLALREGILNAMVHRDYNSVNGFLQISIFNNRTEISNYGGLLEGIAVKDLRIEHHSILRNPDIAHMCFIRKYIEMLGSGTLRMIKDCKVNGFKMPKWSDEKNVMTVVFPDLNLPNAKNEGVSEGVSEGVNLNNFSEQSEGVISELKALLNYIKNNPGLRIPQLAEAMDKGRSTVERYLKQLREKNYIEFKGSPKTGGYFIK